MTCRWRSRTAGDFYLESTRSEEAIKSATKAVPGKVAEADLGKDEGRTIWKIEVIDHNNKTQTVYVDAQTGVARMSK